METSRLIDTYGKRTTPWVKVMAIILAILFGLLFLLSQEDDGNEGNDFPTIESVF